MSETPTVLTMGEPSGIGGEIALKAWLMGHKELPPFCIIDSPNRLRELCATLGLNANVREISNIEETANVYENSLPVLPIKLAKDPIPGKLDVSNSPAVMLAISQAVELTQAGRANALVTNPIHKNVLYQSGFSYPGHTEYLASLVNVKTEPVMMLISERLRVIPVTRHVSIQMAIDTLTPKLIIETAVIADKALRQDFGIANPRIAIAALNPHAGEGGTMGNEEKTCISPAIQFLKAKGLLVTGPMPPDTLFHRQSRDTYDVVLCMYHDQALIPIKTLDFDTAVNVTLGLPFVRTSPDHGTALNIAGKGLASEKSLIAALKVANNIAYNRSKNPHR
ncbi:4-hydroxythreonine-4-phosphate dehydrogenase PdxA [Gammaproteobacteria bacterium]|nr:4-hydroxythreonine-4-phosphate dehydrogenase PdxA [Gammaproteobacteria bacterium]